MCGICGIVSLEHKSSTPLEKVHSVRSKILKDEFNSTSYPSFLPYFKSMLKRLSHRGPQGSGTTISVNAALGAQRLAIRGLNDGMQPITDRNSGVVVLCNGEIDNHSELRIWLAQHGRPVQQATDVAVLPGLYLEMGEEFVEKIRGVFAIVIWDPHKQKLILARDRAGERMLFYIWKNNTIIFATEIAALVAGMPYRLEVDREAIKSYLFHGCFTAPTTPFRDIRKVAPGEIIIFSAGQMQRKRYWRWPVIKTSKKIQLISEFDRIFRNVIYSQSKIDVDYGFFMSGGIDSSLVAAVAAKIRPRRKAPCYTLRFYEPSYDEGVFAERVAGMLGLNIVSVWVKPEMFPPGLRHLISTTGEPLADPAWIPTALLSRRAAEDVRIVFSGEGGDELFGGYPTYPGAILAMYYDRLPVSLRYAIRKIAGILPPSEYKVPLSFLLKKFVEGEKKEPFMRHLLWTASISPSVLDKLGVGVPVMSNVFSEGYILDRLQLYDFETSLAEGLLSKTDRGGMSAAVEIRCPFLDYAVMEFAAALLPYDRVHGVRTKTFLKRYALNYLPRDIVYRRKRGLSVPLARWLRGPLQAWAKEKIKSGRLEEVGISIGNVLSLMQEHLNWQADHSRALWTLLVLDEWLLWKSRRS